VKIYVYNGTYDEDVDIYKSLDLIGNGSDDTIIRQDRGWIVVIRASNVLVKGFRIVGGGDNEYGIYSDSWGHPYYMGHEHVGIRYNTVENVDTGIHVEGIRYSNVADNTVRDTGSYGILMRQGQHYTISGNRLYNNSNGIRLALSSSGNVINNMVNSSRRDGIYLNDGASSYTITDNHVVNSNISYYSISVRSDDNTIHHNVFERDAVDNRSQGFDTGSDNEWHDGIRGNYWSDYNGTDNNGDLIGDEPYRLSSYPTQNRTDPFPLMQAHNEPPTCNITNDFPPYSIDGDTLTLNVTGSDKDGEVVWYSIHSSIVGPIYIGPKTSIPFRLPIGIHNLTVFSIDDRDGVSQNITWRHRRLPYIPPRPDLHFGSTVHNSGNHPAYTVWITMVIDEAEKEKRILNIPPDSNQTLAFKFNHVPGDHRIHFFVDRSNIVIEQNETNNNLTFEITILPEEVNEDHNGSNRLTSRIIVVSIVIPGIVTIIYLMSLIHSHTRRNRTRE
jgi:parallel beta-helix repeat protein